MDNKIIYEQPLTERIRTFLRIEHLFNQVDYYISGEHEFDSRGTISTLLEIIDFLTRSDIKNELCKEISQGTGAHEERFHRSKDVKGV